MDVAAGEYSDDERMVYVAVYCAGEVNDVKYLWHSFAAPEFLPEFVFPSRQGYEHGVIGNERRGVWLVALAPAGVVERFVIAARNTHMPPRNKLGAGLLVKHAVVWAKIGWGWKVLPCEFNFGECLDRFDSLFPKDRLVLMVEDVDALEAMLALVNSEKQVVPKYVGEPVYEHEVLMGVADEMVEVLKAFVEKDG